MRPLAPCRRTCSRDRALLRDPVGVREPAGRRQAADRAARRRRRCRPGWRTRSAWRPRTSASTSTRSTGQYDYATLSVPAPSKLSAPAAARRPRRRTARRPPRSSPRTADGPARPAGDRADGRASPSWPAWQPRLTPTGCWAGSADDPLLPALDEAGIGWTLLPGAGPGAPGASRPSWPGCSPAAVAGSADPGSGDTVLACARTTRPGARPISRRWTVALADELGGPDGPRGTAVELLYGSAGLPGANCSTWSSVMDRLRRELPVGRQADPRVAGPVPARGDLRGARRAGERRSGGAPRGTGRRAAPGGLPRPGRGRAGRRHRVHDRRRGRRDRRRS